MSDSTRHAVFLEPDREVRELLLVWKRRIAARWPSAAYLSHPPHSTIWVGSLTDPDAAGHAVHEAAARASAEAVRLSGPHVFYDDPLAGGGQTLAFTAPRTPALSALQLAMHAAIAPYIADDYPFVGPRWIPHFSVASVPVRRDDPVIREFISTPVEPLVTICRLSWWIINGDRHERLADLRVNR
jgi:hypothetical protein